MRTTIRLNEQLMAETKRYALLNGKSFTLVVEEALREKITYCKNLTPTKRHIKLKTVSGQGVIRGVDLDSSSNLLDAMDA